MNVFALCAFGVCAACAALILRHIENRFALLAAAAAGIIMLLAVSPQFSPALEFARDLTFASGMSQYFSLMAKSLGIALVCRVSCEICGDMGENSIASKIELACKAAIIALSLPVMKRIYEFIKELI